MRKTRIVEELGEGGLLLPALLDAAFQANDRAKLRMTALQEAVGHARAPERAAPAFIADGSEAEHATLDAAVSGARALDGDSYAIPGAAAIVAGILDDIDAMTAPLEAAGASDDAALAGRRDALRQRLGSIATDVLDDAALARITSARRGGPDTAHLLIMDLHKALNALAASIAVETIAGAHALGLAPQDRPRIEAFMRGLARTRGLAFGHPGLDTTASRAGERLVIQNDIGTTDAHVIIITVEGLGARVTYTDVHRARAKFFIGLFAGLDVAWTPLAERSAEGLADEDLFFLVSGRHDARDAAGLDAFLAELGARLVFLIDWNKARKALQTFVDKAAAIRLLRAAALGEHGHRAFLELGGAELVFDAVRRGAEGRVPYGARLDRVLGDAAVEGLLGEVLRLTSEGLAAHRSVRLIRDEVCAALAVRFGSAEKDILALALQQLGIARMLAARLAAILGTGEAFGADERARFGARAKQLEEKADRQVLAARDLASGPFARGGRFLPVVEAVEEATDAFEEAAFLVSIAAPHETSHAHPLASLAEIAVACCSDLVRAVAAACDASDGRREDITDTLEGIEAVMDGERRADAAQRHAMVSTLGGVGPAAALVAELEIARAVETGTDHLARAALALRTSVLEEMAP